MNRVNVRAYCIRPAMAAIIAVAITFTLAACDSTFTDARDGKKYKYVDIGGQTWMAENLKYDAKFSVENLEGVNTYGRLYDWETAKTVCPSGWHLPTKKEWEMLTSYVEKDKNCKECSGKHLKAKKGWEDYEGKSDNSLDSYGFAALPGGSADLDGARSAGDGCWWSASTYYIAAYQYRIRLTESYWLTENRNRLASVRCVMGANNIIDSLSARQETITSSIRPNEKITFGKIYTDTLEFISFVAGQFDNYLDFEKNKHRIVMVHSGADMSEFLSGEIVEIKWKMDIAQGESLFMQEHAVSAKKLKKQPAAAGRDYSSALQTHFPKGTLGESGKTRPIEMFFQNVSRNGKLYSISGKSKTKAAEDAFSGMLGGSTDYNDVSDKISCGGGENKIAGTYRLEEKKSKTSGYFIGDYAACEKGGKLSKAKFEGSWVKHSNGEGTPCSFGL